MCLRTEMNEINQMGGKKIHHALEGAVFKHIKRLFL